MVADKPEVKASCNGVPAFGPRQVISHIVDRNLPGGSSSLVVNQLGDEIVRHAVALYTRDLKALPGVTVAKNVDQVRFQHCGVLGGSSLAVVEDLGSGTLSRKLGQASYSQPVVLVGQRSVAVTHC